MLINHLGFKAPPVAEKNYLVINGRKNSSVIKLLSYSRNANKAAPPRWREIVFNSVENLDIISRKSLA
jgi:hypothetical protein